MNDIIKEHGEIAIKKDEVTVKGFHFNDCKSKKTETAALEYGLERIEEEIVKIKFNR